MSTALALRACGPLVALDPATRAALLDRAEPARGAVADTVAAILARVEREGDAALRDLARRYDGVSLAALEVPRARCDAALAALDPAVRAALERSARALRRAHAAFRPHSERVRPEPGVELVRRPEPLGAVGVYAPGGGAAYASSVLMGAIPARVAGVAEVVLCSPPGPVGFPASVVLAAAALAPVDRVFALGGAGAIAALAFGTASVPRVDRIVGPGNVWVVEAKRQVAGRVGTDLPAGPSELLVIADRAADLAQVARELVAQAEHDPRACAVALLLPGVEASALLAALDAALASLPRADVVRAALARGGAVLEVESAAAALAFANAYAPEHLILATRDAARLARSVRRAGTVFAGLSASCVLGDYRTGGNHVLPTGGAARYSSGLSTGDFVRWTTVQSVSPRAAARLAADAALLAETEGLAGHGRAARAWAEGQVRVAEDGLAPRAAWLDDNVNAFGAPPAAGSLARRTRGGSLRRYPTPEADALRAALAAYAGCAPEEVVTGAGADDVLDLAFRSLVPRGSAIACPDPTFTMVPRLAAEAGLEVRTVARDRSGAVDVARLVATHAPLVYVASPDNPTGVVMPREDVRRLLAGGATVVLDEAYAEFDGAGFIAEAARTPRLIVVRTLSKAFGLAGLRVGYAVGAPETIEPLARLRPPYRVGRLAEALAVRALARDLAWMRSRAARAAALRERFLAALAALGFAPPRSRANFVLVPVPEAALATAALAAAGVRVRAFPGLTTFGDAVRITIGPWPALTRALRALAPFAPAKRAGDLAPAEARGTCDPTAAEARRASDPAAAEARR
jgi:histidinol dehydrogenase